MNRIQLLIVLLFVSLLSACGGGASGSSSFNLEGFVAKGTLKFATVELYQLESNGTEVFVKSVETLADGTYKFTDLMPKAGLKYIIKIKPNSKTVHVDELLGDQILPSTFEMSAITQADGSTITASITPFSHMIVEAARKQTGGLTDANISKAQSTVTEMLGFNPTSIAKNDGVSVEAQKLSILLTAVSQLAKDNAFNCGATPGERTGCVVKTLANAVTTSSLKMEVTVGGAVVNVSSKLFAAVNTTLASNPSLQSAIVVQALNKLNCTTNCTPAVAQEAPTVTAIGKVKTVFDEIRTDLTTMFSSDGVTSTSKGKANLEAFKFQQSFESVNLSIDLVGKDFGAIQAGIKLYNDYKNFPNSPSSANSKYGDFSYTQGLGGNAYLYPSVICTLYQKEPSLGVTQPVATQNGNNGNFIGCSARFSYSVSAVATDGKRAHEYYRHSFTLIPNASGSFDYKTTANKVVLSCPSLLTTISACTTTSVEPLQKDASGSTISHSGSITLGTRDSAGRTTYILSGDLAPGFKLVSAVSTVATTNQSVALARNAGKDTWNLNIQGTEDLVTSEATKVVFSGSVASFDGVGTKISEIAINNGSNFDITNYSAFLDISFSATSGTTTSKLSGVIRADTPVKDKSGNDTIPSKINFTGTLSNSAGGGEPVNFLQGVIDLETKNYKDFDIRLAESLTNTPTQVLSFTGSVTAPDQPKLEIVLSTSGKSVNFQDTAMGAELAFNRYSGGVKNRSVTISVSRTSTTSAKTVSLIESTSGLSMSFLDNDKSAIVKVNGAEVGTWDLSSGLVTFKDGSIASLDIKL